MIPKLQLLVVTLLAVLEFGHGQQSSAVNSRFETLISAARTAQAANDYAAAAADYTEAVKLHPELAELWANLGLMQHELGDASEAIRSFQHALTIKPTLYVPNLFLGIDLQRSGRLKEAIPYLVKAKTINKSDPEASLALGKAYLAAARFMDAVREAEQAVMLDSHMGRAWFVLGIARLNQVERDARKLTDEEKDSPFAQALYAESLQSQARFGEAANVYEKLMGTNVHPPCIRSEYGMALLRNHDVSGAARQFQAERTEEKECNLALLGQARLALENGQKEEASKLLVELWGKDHGFVQSHAALLTEGLSKAIEEEVLQTEEARFPVDLREALSGYPNLHDTVKADSGGQYPFENSLTAEELLADGHYGMCVKRVGKEARNTESLKNMTVCAFQTGNYEVAATAAAALEKAVPQSAAALYWLIRSNESLAFDALVRFEQLEPNSVTSHVLIGDVYRQLNRLDDARDEYKSALAIAPGDRGALLGLARAYFSNNNIDAAKEITSSALVQNPDDPQLNLVMAQVLIEQRRYEVSLPYLQKSLHSKSEILPGVHVLIGHVYAEMGRTREAIEELKIGAASDEDGSVQYLLAGLYKKMGDTKDAAASIERMKEIKRHRLERGFRKVEDPELSALEPSANHVP